MPYLTKLSNITFTKNCDGLVIYHHDMQFSNTDQSETSATKVIHSLSSERCLFRAHLVITHGDNEFAFLCNCSSLVRIVCTVLSN